mgnify:CR=1 FL=1
MEEARKESERWTHRAAVARTEVKALESKKTTLASYLAKLSRESHALRKQLDAHERRRSRLQQQPSHSLQASVVNNTQSPIHSINNRPVQPTAPIAATVAQHSNAVDSDGTRLTQPLRRQNEARFSGDSMSVSDLSSEESSQPSQPALAHRSVRQSQSQRGGFDYRSVGLSPQRPSVGVVSALCQVVLIPGVFVVDVTIVTHDLADPFQIRSDCQRTSGQYESTESNHLTSGVCFPVKNLSEERRWFVFRTKSCRSRTNECHSELNN